MREDELHELRDMQQMEADLCTTLAIVRRIA